MASRRDQLHSYQFMMQRVISSVVLRETDPEQAPLRRGVGAIFGSVMLAAVVAAGFGIYTVISGVEGGRWRQDGAIVIERESGALYVYHDDAEGGVLQQVLNFASARLLSGGEVVRVAGRNLAGVRREPMVGIEGAPDSLPPPGRATGGPWTMCSVLGQDQAGSPSTTTTLLVGAPAPGGEPLDGDGMLVRSAEEGSIYLVWRSHKYLIAADWIVRSLYGDSVQPVEVGAAWLNGLPTGQEIEPIEIPGQGEESSAVAGREVGDLVYHDITGGRQHYLVQDDGRATVTELQALVLQGQYPVTPAEIEPAVARAMPDSESLVPAASPPGQPHTPPEPPSQPVEGLVTLCAETTDAGSLPQVTLGGDVLGALPSTPTGGESPEGTVLADLVAVPPGQIAVVRAMPSPTSPTGALYLVTDAATRFAVPTEEILATLGYDAAGAVEMPAELVERIPAGPTLDPSAAQQPAP